MSDPHVNDSQLMQYVDRLLGKKETAQIREHLEQCSECEFRLRAVERAQEILRAAKHLQR